MATPAKAFVFSDIPAFAQRLANMLLEAKNWIDTTTHYKEMVGHVQEFQKYKNQFSDYYKTFNRVYTRVASGDYTKAFDVTKWDWKHLDDHILRTWSSWNQAWWDAQRLTLMTSELIVKNPAYKKYAEGLEKKMEETGKRLKENEAALREMEKRNKDSRETLDKLKDQNKALTITSGSDPIDAARLQSLNNLIMLEQAAIAAQEAAMKNLERSQEEELKTLQAELKQMEDELRKNAMKEGWEFTLKFMGQEK